MTKLDPPDFRSEVRRHLGLVEKKVSDGDIEAMRNVYDRHVKNADPEMVAMALAMLLLEARR